MHIPNGFLTDPVCTVSTLTSAAALGAGIVRMRQSDTSCSSVLMAATGAGIFAAQMVNFPIDQGTSAHLLGAALAAIALGPWRGMLTMAMILTAQCFLLGDGGASTLGANILNMAVAGTLTASVLYSVATRCVADTRGKLLGAALAAFGSVLASATVCAIELAASGTYGFADVLGALLSVHAAIGLSEALLSVAVVGIALSTQLNRPHSTRGAGWVALVLAVAVAGLIAPLASTAPDGLERVAQDLNFAALATSSWSVMPEWAVAMPLAGIVGVLFVFVSTYTVGRTATAKINKR